MQNAFIYPFTLWQRLSGLELAADELLVIFTAPAKFALRCEIFPD